MAKVKIRSFDMSIAYNFPSWIKLKVMKAGRVKFNLLYRAVCEHPLEEQTIRIKPAHATCTYSYCIKEDNCR